MNPALLFAALLSMGCCTPLGLTTLKGGDLPAEPVQKPGLDTGKSTMPPPDALAVPNPDTTPGLTVYPALPNNQYASELYEVSVSQAGKCLPSYVYKSVREGGDSNSFSTDANHWTSFSFSGPVTVQVKLRDGTAISKATIRPLSRNIHEEVKDNAVSFTLDAPANVYVELDGKPRDPLFVFANPMEADIPAKGAAGVVYFGPGVTDLGQEPLKVPAGGTVYLAGGAYVKGRLQTMESPGGGVASVRGRGILSGREIAEPRGKFSQSMIAATHRAPELHVEGIVVADSPGVSLYTGRRLVAENVKLLSWLPQTDGISGGENSQVRGCFLKVNDDALHFHKTGTQLLDNVVWRQNFGSVLMMGWNETKSVEGERCSGLDIIGDDSGRSHRQAEYCNANVVALIDIHDHAAYRDIVVENVRHEKRSLQLFGVRTMLSAKDKNHAAYRDGRGSVEGMMFKNITAGEMPSNPSVFEGNGREPGTISNVTFDNLRVAGTLVSDANAESYVVRKGATSGFRYLAP